MMHFLIVSALCIIPIIIIVIAIVAYMYQDLIVYSNHFPSDSIGNYTYLPSLYQLKYDDIWIKTEDGVKINGWFVYAPEPNDPVYGRFFQGQNQTEATEIPTIIYFHGNAGNISHRLLSVAYLYRNGIRANVFLVEYRGYGKSEGKPSEEGIKLDARAAFKYIKSRTDINQKLIFAFGRSIGAAVALHLTTYVQESFKQQQRNMMLASSHSQLENNPASVQQHAQQVERLGTALRTTSVLDDEPIAALIIENTFVSIPAMMDTIFPKLGLFRFLCNNKWRNHKEIEKLPSDFPVLFLAGQKDELIPHSMMLKLFMKCSSREKTLKVFPNGQHNDTWTEGGYYEVVRNFVEIVTRFGRATNPTMSSQSNNSEQKYAESSSNEDEAVYISDNPSELSNDEDDYNLELKFAGNINNVVECNHNQSSFRRIGVR